MGKRKKPRESEEREKRQKRINEYKPYQLKFNETGKGHFINPYTFFPLEDAEPERKKPERFYDDKLTGKLTCELKIANGSPLFIPNTTKAFTSGDTGIAAEEDHRWFDFFSYDDLKETKWREEWPSEREPIIPGSSLRGMARSIYEQLTNSCYSQIDEKNYPNKRTNYPKKPYQMAWDGKKKKWCLYETKIYRVGDGCNMCGFDHLQAYECYRVTSSSSNNNGRHYAERVELGTSGRGICCLYHPTGFMEGKADTLFEKARGKFKKAIKEDDVLRRFKLVVDSYCETSTEKNHNNACANYRIYRDRYNEHKPILVYADNSYKYLSPACMSREYFEKTIGELLEKHAPCSGEELCPACRLFGTVNKNTSIGSRVRFSDGMPKPGSYEFDSWTTLPALLSPKISATEFYLKRPKTDGDLYWNYDYYTKSGEDGRRYDSKDGYEAKPNGRKVYLHHSMELDRHYDPGLRVKAKTNVTVHPLKKGEFTFDVYFEDVDKEELTNLVFALGGTKGRLQKLGHGKPLGMGSVKVKVQKIWKRTYACEPSKMPGEVILSDEDITEKIKAEENEGWPSDNSDKKIAARRRLIEHLARNLSSSVPLCAEKDASQANMGQLVRYPTSESGKLSDGNASFEWFAGNRGTVRDPAIKQTLHVPSLEDMGDAHE